VRLVAALVTSLYLPFGASYQSVQPSGASLLVSGSPNTGSGCVWLAVDPVSLTSGRRSRSSCRRPSRAAYPVVPVVIWNRRSQWQDVRLAHVSKNVTYGPVVLRYEDASDTRPQWVYANGSLWLYDVFTTKGSELLRFSAATGRLEQTTAMPRLFRPVIAADADGAWLVAAVNGGVSGQNRAALYHVSAKTGTVTVVHREGRAAFWITAHAHTVWAALISGRDTVALWRFDGPTAKPRLLTRAKIANDTATVAIYGNGGLWGVAPNGERCTKEKVVRIDPTTGREATVAAVPALDGCGGLLFDPTGMTFFRNAFYFLDGPRLYRVDA
jgi:hypothetical protein